MHRHLGPVLGVLLAVGLAQPARAQRSPGQPAIVIHEPRRNPVLPAALIPFTIGAELCRKGHVPVVGMQVVNALTQSVALVRLRQRGAERLDGVGVALHCGDYVAVWDGTIDGGTRVAPPGVYWVNVSVDGRPSVARQLVITQP